MSLRVWAHVTKERLGWSLKKIRKNAPDYPFGEWTKGEKRSKIKHNCNFYRYKNRRTRPSRTFKGGGHWDKGYTAPEAVLKKLRVAKGPGQTVYIYGVTGYGKTELVKQYQSKAQIPLYFLRRGLRRASGGGTGRGKRDGNQDSGGCG